MSSKIKKIILIIILMTTSHCGFEVLKRTDSYNFEIKEISTSGDKRISYKIKNSLLSRATKNSENILIINLNTKKIKIIKEKNIKNQITKYKITLNNSLNITQLNKSKNHIMNFSVNGDYNVGESYSQTLSNENQLIDNLIKNISDKILNEIGTRLNDI